MRDILHTHFSGRVRGPWSTKGPGEAGDEVSFTSDPRLRLSPLMRPSTAQIPMECVLRGETPGLEETVGERKSTWSLGKYEMEDCLRGLGDLKLRAVGGGVSSPRDEAARGERIGEEEGEKLLSSSCNGRGPTVGEEEVPGDLEVAGAAALIVSSRVTVVRIVRSNAGAY